MSLDTKRLEELEQIAAILRRLIRHHPRQAKLERAELQEVEQWIALRRRDGQGERITAA
jgi:hypothetical protein